MNNRLISNSETVDSAFKFDANAVSGTSDTTVASGASYIEDFIGMKKQPRIDKFFVVKPSIKIQNIPFTISESENEFVICNYQWPSLLASGNSLKEAIDNATDLLSDVVEHYVYESEENLSSDGIEFRKYLLMKLFS